MRNTFPVGTLPGARVEPIEPLPVQTVRNAPIRCESIEEGIRHCIEALADRTPPRLPELGTTRDDWPARARLRRGHRR